jgi:hypothetical protein
MLKIKKTLPIEFFFSKTVFAHTVNNENFLPFLPVVCNYFKIKCLQVVKIYFSSVYFLPVEKVLPQKKAPQLGRFH